MSDSQKTTVETLVDHVKKQKIESEKARLRSLEDILGQKLFITDEEASDKTLFNAHHFRLYCNELVGLITKYDEWRNEHLTDEQKNNFPYLVGQVARQILGDKDKALKKLMRNMQKAFPSWKRALTKEPMVVAKVLARLIVYSGEESHDKFRNVVTNASNDNAGNADLLDEYRILVASFWSAEIAIHTMLNMAKEANTPGE